MQPGRSNQEKVLPCYQLFLHPVLFFKTHSVPLSAHLAHLAYVQESEKEVTKKHK